jgi:Fanconi-associated nuclease 1
MPAGYDEPFSLDPSLPPPITHFAFDERTLDLDAIMSCIPADELRKVAKARKIPPNLLVRRDDVCAALRGVARKQTVLGFTPVKGKEAGPKQSTLPFCPKPTNADNPQSTGRSANRGVTSESLLIAQLLPLIGHHAIQLTSSLHNLISRVNLIFSRTPPVTATGSSLLLPSILVSSHRRRYPAYGPPTRSRIWSSRDELLRWERTVKWEAIVQDALGESWQEMRKNLAAGPQGWGGAKKEMLGRVEGSKVVKRIWEGVWPVWREMVEGAGGKEVDVRKEEGGLVGDRFKTGQSARK